MGDIMSGATTLEVLQSALDMVKSLRCNVSGLFEIIASGMKTEEGPTEDKDKNYRIELHTTMQKVYESIRDVDQYVSGLNSPVGPFNLGNTSLVNQEVGSEQIPMYCQLVDSYKWLEKVHEYSAIAGPNLGQNQMKRTYFSASLSAKRRRTLANNYIVSPQAVDSAILGIANTYKDMEITISRPLGTNAILCVNLGRTLRAVVILKGWLIEWVAIRGLSEDFSKEDGIDLWSESRFKVFQKVTDNANAAMLHFCVPTHPELSVRSFMTWLHSFITLFTQPCKKCSLHLSNNMPPTWRDLRSLEPFHEECKP